MVIIYYHVFATPGVIDILNEQFELIEKHFNFEYKLNIGICTSNDNTILNEVTQYLSNKNCIIRNIENCHSEWVTLDLIEGDKVTYNDDDIIMYFHTKGITHIHDIELYKRMVSWRQMMNYFLLERIEYAIDILKNKEYNIYGVTKFMYDWEQQTRPGHFHMMGNFWIVTGEYAKTIDTKVGKRNIRTDVENRFWQLGYNPLPYEAYNFNTHKNIEDVYFTREQYEIK